MIKERPKKKKIDKRKELLEELTVYTKTVVCSLLFAFVFTLLLSFHARSEMIKNLYTDANTKSKLEQKIAKEIVAHSDFTKTLSESNYAVCLQVGRLYEAAEEYSKAEYAYYLATQKAPYGVYTAFYKLAVILIKLDKIEEAERLVESINDTNSLQLIRFKTRIFIVLGDKYFSQGQFLKASSKYEFANYYYSRLSKQDKVIKKSIINRLVQSYLEAAQVIVKNGYNSDAVRFLYKALNYSPDNNTIKYRLAIIYSDLDPIKAVEFFEPLIKKIPQEIDYNVYNSALMKAANIEDLNNNGIKAKYYRYRVHSLDLFTNKNVVYKDDIDVQVKNFVLKKVMFRYKLNMNFVFINNSARDILTMTAEFILRQGNKIKETKVITCASKQQELYSNGGQTKDIKLSFGNNIFTRKELENYYIDIYVYKNPKYKTLLTTYKIPQKSF